MVPRRSQPDPLAVDVGRRVRALRTAKGWNLEKLAWAGGLSSKGHLSDLENGLLVPTIATLNSIAEQLGVELLDLVTFPDKSSRHQLVARTGQLPPATIQRLLAATEAQAVPATAAPRSTVVVVHARRAPRHGVPFVDLVAAAGTLGPGRTVKTDAWVKVDAAAQSLPGAFAARVNGDSMEPLVPSGSIALFRRPGPGNRQGRVFLVQHRGAGAPDDGGAYLLKFVDKDPKSESVVVLRSLNPSHPPIRLDSRRDEINVVAEFVRVIGMAP
jgi:phage repressor protein C with HTH and peptisase S24 domain/DNA-binding Xre family transcriptional regulator